MPWIELPPETFEARNHIEFPKDERAVEDSEIEGGEVDDDGFHTYEDDESDYYEDDYEEEFPDRPAPSYGEPDHSVNQSEHGIKDEQRAWEISKIEEVQNAYQSLKAGLKTGNGRHQISIAKSHFRLYSTDYFDRCYNSAHYPSKYVKCYYVNEDDPTRMIGHITLNSCFGFFSEPFSPPTSASPHGINLTESETQHDCEIKFLNNDYLILMLSRYGVFVPDDPPPGAPHYFTFFGVRFDRDN
ncbi:hypothetical protein BDV36DRAFT_293105 [Aspergillus pseudocaelatus]|uniref:Uncharacterized protein n=1 Tax=Aspergillus pseudocaelatus TaxID=1825620 RepID=A0ABQ6WU91_9EURO|nr:hypothetical protein BDV36DRAFT_293105 [Aspergillus pseudocaelatus]